MSSFFFIGWDFLFLFISMQAEFLTDTFTVLLHCLGELLCLSVVFWAQVPPVITLENFVAHNSIWLINNKRSLAQMCFFRYFEKNCCLLVCRQTGNWQKKKLQKEVVTRLGRNCQKHQNEAPNVVRTRDLEIVAIALQSLALPLSYRSRLMTR